MFHSKSTGQKLNTKSSTEAELVAISDGLNQPLWAASLLESQGYPRQAVALLQDNQSCIKLVKRGRSTSELTRFIEIRYFWCTDLIRRGLITVSYIPTEAMIADYFTKPLQGRVYIFLRNKILGVC